MLIISCYQLLAGHLGYSGRSLLLHSFWWTESLEKTRLSSKSKELSVPNRSYDVLIFVCQKNCDVKFFEIYGCFHVYNRDFLPHNIVQFSIRQTNIQSHKTKAPSSRDTWWPRLKLLTEVLCAYLHALSICTQ